MQYFVCACSVMAKDSLAQSIGFEWVQLSILAGVIDFNSSVAPAATSSPAALSTRQVSQAECRLEPHSPVTRTLFPLRPFLPPQRRALAVGQGRATSLVSQDAVQSSLF